MEQISIRGKNYLRKDGILHKYRPHDPIDETLIELTYILSIIFTLGLILFVGERREETSASWLRPYSGYIVDLIPMAEDHKIRYWTSRDHITDIR